MMYFFLLIFLWLLIFLYKIIISFILNLLHFILQSIKHQLHIQMKKVVGDVFYLLLKTVEKLNINSKIERIIIKI